MSSTASVPNQHVASSRQAGFSLVELMVSLAIGLVVIGAVFANYLNASGGSRHTAAMAQVTGDASVALGILRNHIALAGYTTPKKAESGGLKGDLQGPALVGCDHGFTTASDVQTDAARITCDASGSGSPGLMVRYEADGDMSLTTADPAPLPTDCAGRGISLTGTIHLADNRFQVKPETRDRSGKVTDNPALSCRGAPYTEKGVPASARDDIVDNIESIDFRYGLGVPNTTGNRMTRVTKYVKASDIATPSGDPGNTAWQKEWDKVIAVRVCVVARSAEEVLPRPEAYINCDQRRVDSDDRYIRRAFTSTVLIHNRMVSPDNSATGGTSGTGSGNAGSGSATPAGDKT